MPLMPPARRHYRRTLADILSPASAIRLVKLSGNLRGNTEGGKRMTRLISSLKKSAERPRLMHYALGRDVLRLEPNASEEQE